jgi:hypothetical protein
MSYSQIEAKRELIYCIPFWIFCYDSPHSTRISCRVAAEEAVILKEGALETTITTALQQADTRLAIDVMSCPAIEPLSPSVAMVKNPYVAIPGLLQRH